ncbi:accessory factor UbiK family protein [Dongia sedimenti]|uniref:Accessory factor UbiK family protein n=1 Tax=Dongia sedimenti TaxID=3064282 RepID=A0ABU0YSZ0_9PROT|nr:accessory factor UbiK family protein [Rhodospirillaceae bacterium R-7]
MQTDNRLLDDMAKAASGALGSLAGLRHEIEMRVQQQLERLLGRMNLVGRDEFEAMKAVAQAAREQQIKLERRLEEIEARLNGTPRATELTDEAASGTAAMESVPLHDDLAKPD